MSRYRLGIDVGGTNTDAVVLDNTTLKVVAAIKTPTTANPSDGIINAIDEVLAASGVDPGAIAVAMLGTTHATNAVVERRGLGRVGVIRLGAPATTAVPPLEGWPEDLRSALTEHAHIVKGGLEVDGRAIANVDPDEIKTVCRQMRGVVDAVAVVGVFSPIDSTQEESVAAIAAEELNVPISMSAQLGKLGLLERENATILNAALIETLRAMAAGLRTALEQRGIAAHMYFGQNDGTLMAVDYALRFPVLTIGGGPTNSLRGAAHLSGLSDALVVDIGGTTTDIGMLVKGFPRQSADAVTLGGVRTNFRMPDILSIGLGGGTIVREYADGRVTVGPDSVGYRIVSEARAFGGNTTTATDISLASGVATIDGIHTPELPEGVVSSANTVIRELLEDAVDRMKVSSAAVSVILVGGGSIIVNAPLAGVKELIRPPHHGAANAVGVALGDIAGEADKLVTTGDGRKNMREIAAQEAIDRAVQAGADPASVEVTSVDELPVSYSAGESVRIHTRAVGRLRAAE